MCGIVGYAGKEKTVPTLIDGLKRLEYRGYDSAGIAVISENNLVVKKAAGKVSDLEAMTRNLTGIKSAVGIAHTRWATHGEPNEVNAHPHVDCTGRIGIVHNGIIENYKALKTYLEDRGHRFVSKTDTEVIAHLIEEFMKKEGATFMDAFIETAQAIKGSYAIAAVSLSDPGTIYATHLSSPLVIGQGNGENFIASDASPFLGRASKIIYLPENEIAVVAAAGIKTFDLDKRKKDPVFEKFEGTLESIQKGNFPHFMLKEIYEQPERIEDAFRGRLLLQEGNAFLGGLSPVWDKLLKAKRFVISACGTSWHAALVGKYMFEEIARVPTEVDYASELRYRNPILGPDDVVFVISQSGETADTLATLREAKKRGATVLGIVNVVGSTIAREAGVGVYIHAGPEIGVASTKTFTSQLAVLTLITLAIGRGKGMSKEKGKFIASEINSLPEKARRALGTENLVREIARTFKDSRNFLYLGRGANFPTALEGALKLKEISYIHAEGYPVAEMKHGPIALIDENMPVVFVVPKDGIYEKVLSNMEEVKARKGRIIAIANEDDEYIDSLADFVIRVPRTLGWLGPIVNVIPLQLLAYHIALELGRLIDQPRNLAKSVTVE
ncbi:MAG: Isomerizing Glutamine-fructose-6-phosphate aminotransferase [Candidatus Jorgensenbacteria bacterium GW2011_GWA1_48_11]|uniref:Glutamine--fructose-6-phosphate aminotransferase [isomerizing] n=1 Tax=Candidatus Jorgensenbacteria bacterium GW2011_GWA1_48_11 TaxID=1618660 RepID=A0A0G1XAA4_9BACT|nr:MAG: Isomerizing Glutamine-fructose-6-phosphate aminotransferase [Candidatus Jorgensenbacteria bacterium GW2011_GWA1_48_11]KKW12713.1 MAG: Isomerizing Glutamine-fructose-6-phosphate aminotransferase [Candidatus Jorgensenbacteria bacterium GW2011_GWB1_49_9]